MISERHANEARTQFLLHESATRKYQDLSATTLREVSQRSSLEIVLLFNRRLKKIELEVKIGSIEKSRVAVVWKVFL